jgi:polar amino acid transport system permease protein
MSHARTKRLTRITISAMTFSILGLLLILELAFGAVSHFLSSLVDGLKIVRFDVVLTNLRYLLLGPPHRMGGVVLTLYLAVISLLLAFVVGLIFGLMRNSTHAWIKYPAVAYIELVRGMPLIMVIFWFVFLLPKVFGYVIDDIYNVIIAFVCFSGAYMAEIVRAGILSIGRGQMEAARSTGLTQPQAMIYIILPQALKNMIPSFVNQFMSLTKDTSLAWFVGLFELTTVSSQVSNRVLIAPTEIFLFCAMIYFIICYSLSAASRWLERKLRAGAR